LKVKIQFGIHFMNLERAMIYNRIDLHQNVRLPAEWERQSGILLALPHKLTDWNYMLDEVLDCYRHIIASIIEDEPVLLVVDDINEAKSELAGLDLNRIIFHSIGTNDTWTRDYGPIPLMVDGKPELCDFLFNAWGMKFAAEKDNLVTSLLADKGAFTCPIRNHRNFVLEGGSIESDGNGTLLTTSNCLLSPNRNGASSKSDIDVFLKSALGVKNILWLNHGSLSGDDTDGHIDTLARFVPCNRIAYVASDYAADCHYEELELMERELASFINNDGKHYELVKLPLPDPIFDENGEQLPATYANFLIMNHQVLVPTYRQPEKDGMAIDIIGQLFPDRKVVGIDCSPLIKQHGSLHCSTMQLPENALKL
jgi:agmatine deiminase